jgi:hypothetical protein
MISLLLDAGKLLPHEVAALVNQRETTRSVSFMRIAINGVEFGADRLAFGF